MASRVNIPPVERLFSLVLALIATESGLTKSEILSTVRGYAERYDQPGAAKNLDRQFERDKDELRELGIPLEVFDTPGSPDDNQLSRYRIPKAAYDLPDEVRFTPDEFALLRLAAEVWREQSLSADSQRALTKLRAIGVDPSEPVIGYAPRLRVRDAAFDPLRVALDSRATVRFSYFTPGRGAPRERTADPLAIVSHEGRWHLHAFDHDADAPRTFLLSRITGDVVTLSERSVHASPEGVQHRILAELEEIRLSNRAVLRVSVGSDAEVRLGRRAITPESGSSSVAHTIALHFTDAEILADELASYGPEVVVLEPESLRDAVRARLRTVLEAHGQLGRGAQ